MHRLLIAFAIFTLTYPSTAIARDLATMKGSWICQSGCGCAPASPQKYASIAVRTAPGGKQEGVLRNECGNESAAEFTPGRIRAAQWNLGGGISADNNTISWDNASVWKRQPANVSELERRMAYWESRYFYCPSPLGPFPSKESENGAPACDDGDSVMFNALLCRSGDARGCNAVKLSQDKDGRFWRSPEKQRLRPAEPPGLQNGQTTFSGDHAAGLFVYFGHTGDRDAFARWIKWIDSNERCLTWCGGLPPVKTPRYCKNDRCALRFGDCQTLLLLGARMNVGVPFCKADPFNPLPTVTNAAQTLKNTYDETVGKLPIKPPEFDLLRKNFDNALAAYQKAVEPLERLRTKLEAELVETLLISQLEKAISARVNHRGYSRHNALVGIMMLEDWGLGRKWMNAEARRVAKDEPLNPFFQFVAYRKEDRQRMLADILEECPAESSDKRRLRRQWSWERDTSKREWVDTMYWDCSFVGRMYLEQGSPSAKENVVEAALRQVFGAELKKVAELHNRAAEALEKIRRLIKKPVDTVRDEAKKEFEEKKEKVEKFIEKPLDAITPKLPEKPLEKPLDTIKKLSPF